MSQNSISCLISEQELQQTICQYGTILTQEYQDKPLLLLGVLSGSFLFLADLCRQIKLPLEIAFIRAKSYLGTQSQGSVQIDYNLTEEQIRTHHILLVEDIVDTGLTLTKLTEKLQSQHPLSLKTITLLDKPARRTVPFQPDYHLFTIEDQFVIGYGLDYDERYRNLPYIGVLH